MATALSAFYAAKNGTLIQGNRAGFTGLALSSPPLFRRFLKPNQLGVFHSSWQGVPPRPPRARGSGGEGRAQLKRNKPKSVRGASLRLSRYCTARLRDLRANHLAIPRGCRGASSSLQIVAATRNNPVHLLGNAVNRQNTRPLGIACGRILWNDKDVSVL